MRNAGHSTLRKKIRRGGKSGGCIARRKKKKGERENIRLAGESQKKNSVSLGEERIKGRQTLRRGTHKKKEGLVTLRASGRKGVGGKLWPIREGRGGKGSKFGV